MIAGYYGAAFFGGAKYMKIYDDNQRNTCLEWVESGIPNLIYGAEDCVRNSESITDDKTFADWNLETSAIIKRKLASSEKKSIVEYLKTIDLQYLSEQIYTDCCLDSLCWQVFVFLEGRNYQISGYHVMPKEVKRLLKLMEELI